MPIVNSDNSNEDFLATQVRADKIRLLYLQSYQAVFSTLVVAGLWVTLLWNQASHSNLMIWLGLLAVTTLGRILLFIQYQRHSTDANVLKWIAPYTLTVLASALVWGL
jgi:cytochrome c-type biogenesis protein CcmH/NrfF